MGDTIASRSEQTIPFSGCVDAAASPQHRRCIPQALSLLRPPPILFSDRDRAGKRGREEGAALAVELMQKEGSDEDERERLRSGRELAASSTAAP